SIVRLELRRSPATSFRLEHDLWYDAALWRHVGRVARIVKEFRPDVLHFTGPSDIGQLAVWLGLRQRIPMLASWHTKVHEYAARRLSKHVKYKRVLSLAETSSFAIALLFYKVPRVVLAPNADWQTVLERRTSKPTFVMTRGVDTTAFGPERRRRVTDT